MKAILCGKCHVTIGMSAGQTSELTHTWEGIQPGRKHRRDAAQTEKLQLRCIQAKPASRIGWMQANKGENPMKIENVSPYLCVSDAAAAIDFYQRAFGASETYRLAEPSGRIAHAEMAFGQTTIMLADEFPEYDIRSASTIGATPVTLHLQVDNADAVIERAVQAGATLERPPADQFYGKRSGTIRDPFGHRWSIAHHIENVSNDEMQRRYEQMLNGDGETAA